MTNLGGFRNLNLHPPEVQRASRDLLAKLGLPEPPGGGWDSFEGERDKHDP